MSVAPSPSKGGFAAVLAASLFSAGPAMLSAQAPGAFEDVQWTRAPDGIGFDYAWTGKPDRYYFIEQSPDLSADSWSFFPYAVKGDGGSEGLFLNPSSERFFLRLRYTDSTDDPLLLEDFNASGFSNRVELDAGGNPFNMPDADGNGVPDSIDAFWADEVPDAWKQALPDDPDKAFYDPDNAVATLADVRPGDDYDGDGRSNLREYLDGTDPADFFNGASANIIALGGDGQNGGPGEVLAEPFLAAVSRSDGASAHGAPVIFEVASGHAGLGTGPAMVTGSPQLNRTVGANGAAAYFLAPATYGEVTVTARIPGGSSVAFSANVVTADSAAKAPIRQFRSTDNDDGTTTYTWISDADSGDWFRIERRSTDGTWATIYETTYGSPALPFDPGTDDYTLTIPTP